MMVTNPARFGTEKAREPLQRVHRAGIHLFGRINQMLGLFRGWQVRTLPPPCSLGR
jgi:hypothetical protein